MQRLELAPGLIWWPGHLDRPAQERLLAAVERALEEAPLFSPACRGPVSRFRCA